MLCSEGESGTFLTGTPEGHTSDQAQQHASGDVRLGHLGMSEETLSTRHSYRFAESVLYL